MKKTWCRHIKWQPYEKKWWVFQAYIAVPHSWKLCPICGTERPTKQNTKAAKLRFEMDNDQ